MTTVVPCATSTLSLIPGTSFILRKDNNLIRYRFPKKSSKPVISLERRILPLLPSVRTLPQHRRDCSWLHKCVVHTVSATGADTNVVVEEPDSPVTDENSVGASDFPADAAETSEKSSIKSDANRALAQSKRSRPGRRSEFPPVKNEDLVPGATFTGKVKSIQPFGAFVDFGAFTDGLVHVSRLSNSFVKDVGSVVSIGQEVTVTLVEANNETGRISLSMRENDDTDKLQQQKDAPATAGSSKPRPARRNTAKSGQKREDTRTSKFVKGQDLLGTVKNLTRSGAFISLPEGEEGFLPTSEESDGGLESMMGGSSLEVGQEVNVRVLRVARGQVTLTMKEEEDNDLDVELVQGVVHTATNPFVLAFRKNKDIALFLDEREKMEKVAKEPAIPKTPMEVEGEEKQTETASDISGVQEKPLGSDAGSVGATSTVVETVYSETSPQSVERAVQTTEEEAEESSEVSDSTESESVADNIIEEAPLADETVSDGKPGSSQEVFSESLSPVNTVTEEVVESQLGGAVTNDEVQSPGTETEISPIAPVEDEGRGETTPDEKTSITGSGGQTDAPTLREAKDEKESVESSDPAGSSDTTEIPSSESRDAELVGNQVESTKDKVEPQASVLEAEIPSAIQEENEKMAPPPEKSDSVANSNGQTESFSTENVVKAEKESVENSDRSGSSDAAEIQSSESQDVASEENQVESTKDEVEAQASVAEAETSTVQGENEKEEPAPDKSDSIANSNGQGESSSTEKSIQATISPALVKQLREETGAGMMDCKKALSESGGDIVKAQEYLRKKGLASAEKKASRATAEGRIGSYIHDGRIGVLVEVNCETDFVSRGEIFKELVDDVAMQVAACPQVQYLVTEDVPEEIVNKEKEIEMQKEDLLSKPEQIRSKIVEGRIRKRLEELALLQQPYIKNDKFVVKDWLKQTIANIGENIKVRRFVRFNLGEGLEKKSQDFAAEVAAQTAAKPVAAPPTTQEPASAETKEPFEKPPPAVAISAALVKQLREETGAGMMDCKKALSETGGDLEKAQEYLRKKGLSSADKKSSRLAAEGRIGTYIHDSRIGVLIEVNCETDFVGRSEKFKELVDDLAMQAVACSQVQFVSVDEIPESFVKEEKELEMQREDLAAKPENIREKIVEGRISKRLGELALLEQPFIKDDSILVKDLVKQTVAAIGENIKVRRFVRFTLGEKTEDEKAETEA